MLQAGTQEGGHISCSYAEDGKLLAGHVFKVFLWNKHITSLWMKTLLQTLFYPLYIPLRQENPHPFLSKVVYILDFV